MYCYWSCADLEINFLHACRQHGTPRNNMPKKSNQQFPKWNYDLLINDWNNICCKTKHHHVNANCTIEKQLAFWIVFLFNILWEPLCKRKFWLDRESTGLEAHFSCVSGAKPIVNACCMGISKHRFGGMFESRLLQHNYPLQSRLSKHSGRIVDWSVEIRNSDFQTVADLLQTLDRYSIEYCAAPRNSRTAQRHTVRLKELLKEWLRPFAHLYRVLNTPNTGEQIGKQIGRLYENMVKLCKITHFPRYGCHWPTVGADFPTIWEWAHQRPYSQE